MLLTAFVDLHHREHMDICFTSHSGRETLARLYLLADRLCIRD